MRTEEFNEIIQAQVDICLDILGIKAKEYATDKDKLHNFKVAAVLQDETPIQALQGMMTKHTISINDMCNSGEDYHIAVWNEKITDSINYLLLLKALVIEEQKKITQECVSNG